jgi:hypothetical protein
VKVTRRLDGAWLGGQKLLFFLPRLTVGIRDLSFDICNCFVNTWLLVHICVYILRSSSHGFGFGYFHLDGTVPRLGIIQTDCLANCVPVIKHILLL